jgi:hypothetical protein
MARRITAAGPDSPVLRPLIFTIFATRELVSRSARHHGNAEGLDTT